VTVQIADPLADTRTVQDEYGIALRDNSELKSSDAVIVAVAHDAYVDGGWPLVQRLLRDGAGLVFDIKARFDRSSKPTEKTMIASRPIAPPAHRPLPWTAGTISKPTRQP
jgi:UDP-N-acetyl-D-galactosamine dehydrogenase